jgi:hypothetical protein
VGALIDGPITVFPRYPEQLGVALDDPTSDQEWAAFGSEVTTNIYAAIQAALPPTYLGLYLQKYVASHKGSAWWDVAVHYGKTIPLQAENVRFTCETTGKNIHLDQSIDSVAYYGTATTPAPPTYNGLIGVTDDNVQGVDVPSPGMKMNISKRFLANTLAPDFLQTIIDMSACVNISPFVIIWKGQILAFDAGELLFHGASVSDPGRDVNNNELIELQYQLEGERNVTDLVINGSSNISKNGWDYLWVTYVRQVQSGRTVKLASGVYVEQVLYYDDFSKLQLS